MSIATQLQKNDYQKFKKIFIYNFYIRRIDFIKKSILNDRISLSNINNCSNELLITLNKFNKEINYGKHKNRWSELSCEKKENKKINDYVIIAGLCNNLNLIKELVNYYKLENKKSKYAEDNKFLSKEIINYFCK